MRAASSSPGRQGGSRFQPRWGPSYDGVVVHSFRYEIRDYLSRMSKYDLIFGLSTADALLTVLNDEQLQFGLKAQERNKLLSDLVSETFEVHQREIFSAILTQYTDWTSTNRQPVNVRDWTVAALQDGLYSAPLVETGDYHSSLNPNSWFYVADYQTKNSHYNQVCQAGTLFCFAFALECCVSKTLIIKSMVGA